MLGFIKILSGTRVFKTIPNQQFLKSNNIDFFANTHISGSSSDLNETKLIKIKEKLVF